MPIEDSELLAQTPFNAEPRASLKRCRVADKPGTCGVDSSNPSAGRVCLPAQLSNNYGCSVDAQCQVCAVRREGICAEAASLATAPLNGCNAEIPPSATVKVRISQLYRESPESSARTTVNATPVSSQVSISDANNPGICDDHIANDGYQKVCLEGPGRTNGESCDVDRQCGVSSC